MATVQFNAPLGADKTKVVLIVGSAIGGSAVQITIDTTVCKSKLEAMNALEAIEQKITELKWPSL